MNLPSEATGHGAGAPPEARTIHPVDVHVGHRLRARRKQLAVSQERLAGALRITFQQVQKYERGRNRVSASVLYQAARFLKTTPGWFFEGLPLDDGTEVDAQVQAKSLEPVIALAGLPEGFDLARDYGALDPDCRRLVAKMARTLVQADGKVRVELAVTQ